MLSAGHRRMYPCSSSALVAHALTELEIIGEEPEITAMYLRVIQAFADFGHSGGSASVAIPVINELLQHHALSPLTDDPDEWLYHTPDVWGDAGGKGIWQNRRNSEAFSEDGGKTYYLLSEGDEGEDYPVHESQKKENPGGQEAGQGEEALHHEELDAG